KLNSCFLTSVPDFTKKKILIMGLGSTGSTVELIKYLAKKGANITVTDIKGEKELIKTVDQLQDLNIDLHLGRHYKEDFTKCDILFVNPAVKLTDPFLQIAIEHNVKLDSEINLFYRLNRKKKIIAVTGTKGKTTTVKLAHDLIRNLGNKIWMGGNNGISLLNKTANISDRDYIILEISSFQLQTLGFINFHPYIGCCLAITEEHLDHHQNFDEYIEAKSNICRLQLETEFTVLNPDTSKLKCFKNKSKLLIFSETDRNADFYIHNGSIYNKSKDLQIKLTEELRMKVLHPDNLLASVAITSIVNNLSNNTEIINKTVKEFIPDQFRMQSIVTINGKTFINDSASTHPSSTINALKILKDKNVILIFGGLNKGLDIQSWVKKIGHPKLKAVLLIGPTSTDISVELNNMQIKNFKSSNLKDAVAKSLKLSDHGDTILFSPGFSSLYCYNNYIQRGEEFNHIIHKLFDKK
ncbi:MAG: UDP-N-acetylmuramoyl-L-alanine--D-glutamate ligase, partial [Planctomycetes bacterium]|nr:UDP-N-acetylmuramoyl-L-alanine--D-glutamate ligase [Planctomycetota bacterium]